jgi:phasin family protein
MQTNPFAHWENLTNVTIANGKRLEALNLKLTQQLLQKQIGLFSTAVDAGKQLAAVLGEGKPMPEIFAEQTKLVSAYGSKAMATAREASEIAATSYAEYRTWFEESFKEFSEQARAAVAATVPMAQARKAA